MISGQSRHGREQGRARDARERLDRLRDEGEILGTSALARSVQRAADHFAARDATGADGASDAVELWGRRIGRALSVIAFIGLCIYLYLTYLR